MLCPGSCIIVISRWGEVIMKSTTGKSTHRVLGSARIPGLNLTGHEFVLPLNHARPDEKTIRVFAREVVAIDKERRDDLPWIVFFQGGPGFPAGRPETNSGWIKRAVQDYRVLLLDQRGTGLSTPVTHQTLSEIKSPAAQAEYLSHFRADSIICDAELIRKQILGGKKWIGMGQSFGGFCMCTYLSLAPEGLDGALITGGIPPIGEPVDDVYRATYRRVLEKNKRYFARYPDDADIVKKVFEHLSKHEVSTPQGERISPRRIQQLGLNFGFSSGFEKIHYALEQAFVEIAGAPQINYAFTRATDTLLDFNTNPIYSLLHEAIYCEGNASNWSAERVRGEFPEFELNGNPTPYFTGEMIYPWMFDEYNCLRPLKETAEILAAKEDWPKLYDLDVLRQNTVPAVATIYYEDMYVETQYSDHIARQIPNLKIWVTNEFEHSGIRDDGERILDRMLGMLKGAC